MAVKSVIDIEINDQAFKTFNELFQKYKEEVKKMPEDWAKVGGQIESSSVGFGDMVAAMIAQSLLLKTMEENEKRRNQNANKQVSTWKAISKYSKDVADNIATGTRWLLKWSSLVGVVGGFAGINGLFGLEHLAKDVGTGRRASLGLGTNYGEQKAFEINYGRVVDPNQMLSGVNEALHDITKRYSLYGAGLTDQDIQGKNTAQVSAELIPLLKRLADTTPEAVMQQTIDARGLGQFVTLQDLKRLRDTPAAEVAGLSKSYEKDRQDLALPLDTQVRWQNFSAQLTRAGNKIETTFVKGLAPLVPSLERLSGSVADAIGTFMKSIKPEDVDALGKNIGEFAKYLASPEFRKDLHDFGTDISTLAGIIASSLRLLGGHTIRDTAAGAGVGFAVAGPVGALVGGAGGFVAAKTIDQTRGANGEKPSINDTAFGILSGNVKKVYSLLDGSDPAQDHNANRRFGGAVPTPGVSDGVKPGFGNPGNLRTLDSKGFKQFSSNDDGIRAMANQLQRYEFAKNWGGLDTLNKIISTYAPSNENNTKGYVDFVSKRTGIGADDKVDLHDTKQLSTIMSAMLKMENKKNNYSPQDVEKILRGGSDTKQLAAALKKQPPAKVSVTINNNTGGSAVVAANQAAH